jgi:hypothetical protein
MSLDQTFKSFLKEDNSNPSIPSTGNVLVGLNSEEQDHILREVNSMLAALTDSPALNPYYIVERLKTRLKLVLGLSFDDTYFLGNVGSFERRLVAHNSVESVYGGSSVIPHDNAWMKLFPHGLVIKIQFLKSGPLYNVNAELAAVPDPAQPPPISED